MRERERDRERDKIKGTHFESFRVCNEVASFSGTERAFVPPCNYSFHCLCVCLSLSNLPKSFTCRDVILTFFFFTPIKILSIWITSFFPRMITIQFDGFKVLDFYGCVCGAHIYAYMLVYIHIQTHI